MCVCVCVGVGVCVCVCVCVCACLACVCVCLCTCVRACEGVCERARLCAILSDELESLRKADTTFAVVIVVVVH